MRALHIHEDNNNFKLNGQDYDSVNMLQVKEEQSGAMSNSNSKRILNNEDIS